MTIDIENKEKLIWPDNCTQDTQGNLLLGGVNTVELANQYGTPLYIFDQSTIQGHCRSYRSALEKYYPAKSGVHYASKAFVNTAVVSLLKEEGMGFDVVSIGELAMALRSGIDASSIHFHGNAKPEAELKRAIEYGVGSIVIDNLDEIDQLINICNEMGRTQKVLIRITPAVDTDTHPHIQTGQRTSKFGVPMDFLDDAVAKISQNSCIELAGLHFHLGSQIESAEPYVVSVDVVLDLYQNIRDTYGITMTEISPGGGFGVVYNNSDNPETIDSFIKKMSGALVDGCEKRGLDLPKLYIEPGRSIIARSAISLYSVIARKHIPAIEGEEAVNYVHIDGGMGDNIRPSLYAAEYTACVANRLNDDENTEKVRVAGRYCESGDVLLKNADMPKDIEIGDKIAVAGVGAYTLCMSSSYNMVPRPAVLMVNENGAHLIQKRETEEDMFGRDLNID